MTLPNYTWDCGVDNVPGYAGTKHIEVQAYFSDEAMNYAENITGGQCNYAVIVHKPNQSQNTETGGFGTLLVGGGLIWLLLALL